MKRCITIFLLLLAVAGLWAQTNNFPASQLFKAMECRMMKVTAVVSVKNDQKVENPPKVSFTLFYGAQSSGYASEDYIVLLGDDTDEWNRNGYLGFMDMPDKIYRDDTPLRGGRKNIIIAFYAENSSNVTMWTAEAKKDAHPDIKSETYISVGHIYNDKKTTFAIYSCDFYDISSGRERLVLSNFYPSAEDYSAGNLFRVFMDNMYEYYNQ